MKRIWTLGFLFLVILALVLVQASPLYSNDAAAAVPLPSAGAMSPTPQLEPAFPVSEVMPVSSPSADEEAWPGAVVASESDREMSDGRQVSTSNPPPPPGGTLLVSVGGPDDFGYRWDDSKPFPWFDATGGVDSGLNPSNDHTGPIALPFTFSYYERNYSNLYISAYGYLTFQDDGYWPWQSGIPSGGRPNSVIAPYWTPLILKDSGADGRVYYKAGGVAPSRYFIVEWHHMVFDDDSYTFEAILFESGTIALQYQEMTYIGGYACGSAGIEDWTGTDGLAYSNSCAQIASNSGVIITRPDRAARVRIFPSQQSRFVNASDTVEYSVPVRNSGDFGPDTFEVSAPSAWPLALYKADGVTPLTDTDQDGTVDTGSLAQGSTSTITVRVAAPQAATIGSNDQVSLTLRSSLDSSKQKTALLQAAVPTSFAQAFMDGADGAMAVSLVQPGGQYTTKVTYNNSFGSNTAVAELPNGFAYFWTKSRYEGKTWSTTEIEFMLMSRYGYATRLAGKFTDHSGSTLEIRDSDPTIAVAPNGRIGVLWVTNSYDYSGGTTRYQSNVFLSLLDPLGNTIVAPINITGNDQWYQYGSASYGVPVFLEPRVTATRDNCYVLTWRRSHQQTDGAVDDIYYATYDMNGIRLHPPTKLTNDTASNEVFESRPVVAFVGRDRAVISWLHRQVSNDDIFFSVVSSVGSIIMAPTLLSDGAVVDWNNHDAVQLADGRILLAWQAFGCPGAFTARIRYAVLDTAYNRVVPPTCLSGTESRTTRDDSASLAADSAGHAVMTWLGAHGTLGTDLYYTLFNGDGSAITPPMILRSSQSLGSSVYTSLSGYGVTSYTSPPPARVAQVSLPMILKEHVGVFVGPWEAEPNDTYLQANGPLRSGQNYYGYPNDTDDYFSIYVASGGTITVDLTSFGIADGQLQLYYQSTANRVGYDPDAPYRIEQTGPAGWYYIRVYTPGGFNSATPYTLRVTYPQ